MNDCEGTRGTKCTLTNSFLRDKLKTRSHSNSNLKLRKTVNKTLTKKTKSNSIPSTNITKNMDIREAMKFGIGTKPSKMLVENHGNYLKGEIEGSTF